jgi:hypothetical protein
VTIIGATLNNVSGTFIDIRENTGFLVVLNVNAVNLTGKFIYSYDTQNTIASNPIFPPIDLGNIKLTNSTVSTAFDL